MERTLIILKPDAVQRGLIGEILSRLEKKGLKLVGIQLRQFPRKLIEEQRVYFEIIYRIAEDVRVDHVLTNSFGFGGTNAALVLSRYKGD